MNNIPLPYCMLGPGAHSRRRAAKESLNTAVAEAILAAFGDTNGPIPGVTELLPWLELGVKVGTIVRVLLTAAPHPLSLPAPTPPHSAAPYSATPQSTNSPSPTKWLGDSGLRHGGDIGSELMQTCAGIVTVLLRDNDVPGALSVAKAMGTALASQSAITEWKSLDEAFARILAPLATRPASELASAKATFTGKQISFSIPRRLLFNS